MKRKITPLQKIAALALTVALIAMTVSPAFAVEHLYLSNSELNYYTYNIMSTANYAKGRYFMGNDEYLSRMTFYISNGTNSVTGNVTAKLYNTTAAHLPSTLLETSTTNYDLSNLAVSSGTYVLVDFEFADTYLLDSAVEYCVTIEFILYGSNYRIALSNNGEGGITRSTGAWSAVSLQPIFYLYTDSEEGGGSPYTPPGTADVTSWDNIIASFTAFIVPLLVVLLPAFLLCFITRRVDKWLIIIGVTIGAGLGYYFNLVPLWLVFLVTIGLIGMAYQSVRGGNS